MRKSKGEEQSGAGRSAGRSSRATNTAAVLTAVAVIGALLVAWFALERGLFTQTWREAAARELSQTLGAPVSVDAVGVGVNRLVLHGIEGDGPASPGAERVVVGVSWADVLMRRADPLEAVRWVEIQGLEAEVPWEALAGRPRGDAPQAGIEDGLAEPGEISSAESAPGQANIAAWLQSLETLLQRVTRQTALAADRELPVRFKDGRVAVRLEDDGETLEAAFSGVVAWHDGRLVLQRLTVGGSGLEMTLNGALLPRIDLYARVTADDLSLVLDSLPRDLAARAPARAGGAAELEAWLTGSPSDVRAWGTMHLQDLLVTSVGAAADSSVEIGGRVQGEDADARENAATGAYAVDEAVGYWAYDGSGLVEARVEARRKVAKVWLDGVVDPSDVSFHFAVDATDVDVPGDLPLLARYEAAGLADFSGTLTGTPAEPKLEGSLASDGGRLWGQPYSRLQGHIELTRERFAFERVVVAQGASEYYLEGVVGFGSRRDGEPGYLDLVARTDRGRAETVTAVLGWNVPLEASLAGAATFSGPLGDVAARGNVSLTHGVAYGQPFDRLGGNFSYGDGMFSVSGVEGSVRGGVVRLDGGGRWSGPWRLTVRADEVPLQAVAVVRDSRPDVSGLAAFDGVVEVEAPGAPVSASGTLAGRHLYVGSVAFSVAEGRAVLRDGDLTAERLSLQRTRGGTYTVSGTVSDATDRASLDLTIDVVNESAGDLTALLGWTPPVPVTGDVSASIRLQGTADDPEAHIRLDAPAVSLVGRTVGLGLKLRLKDGRIEVEEWERGMPAGV